MRLFFRLSIVCALFLASWIVPASAMAEITCIEVFYPASFHDVDYSGMETSLATDYQQHGARFTSTEKFLGINRLGQVLFAKKHPFIHWPGRNREMPWLSTKNSIFGTTTPQGDLRSFIGIFGPRLSRYFGFEILQVGEDSILKAPGAHLLKSIVLRLNRQLKKNKKNPIVYLPVQAGLLNAEEMLNLSVSADGDFAAYFPYADNDAKLTGHEIAYHLGEMAFPKRFHEKSREIDLETLRVARLLRISGLPIAEQVAQSLMAERARELDFGNGNILTSLASFRIKEHMTSFDGLYLPPEIQDFAIRNLQSLIHPSLTPREAVFETLIRILDFKEADLVSEPSTGRKLVRAVRHPLTDQAKYLQFLRSLQATNRALDSTITFERMSPEEYWNDLVLGLDARIKELLEAFEQITK